MTESVIENLAAVKREIAETARAAARKTLPNLIVAVKYADAAQLETLLEAGECDVGENRVQQFLAHAPLYEKYPVRVHFIGTLQKNKVKYLVGRVATICSVCSVDLAEEIEKQAAKKEVTVRVLVEINSGREDAKSGAAPEEAEGICRRILELPHLALEGFMTMCPKCDTVDGYRHYFKTTVTQGLAIWKTLELGGRPRFSMGMSGSLTAAILEGADEVRVGRRIFATESLPQTKDE